MRDMEGTELQTYDVVECLDYPGCLWVVSGRQHISGYVRVLAIKTEYVDQYGYADLPTRSTRLVERKPSPEYYERQHAKMKGR